MVISKALTDSHISRDEFILVNNVLKEYYDVKDGIKKLRASCVART